MPLHRKYFSGSVFSILTYFLALPEKCDILDITFEEKARKKGGSVVK